MNYIWDMLIHFKDAGIKKESITFLPAQVYSPYMELAFECLNTIILREEYSIEVNPYYRYHRIFKNMFLPDNEEAITLRKVLFDLLLHHLADLDRYMGMNRQEFHLSFLEQDIVNNGFGLEISREWQYFTRKEKRTILNKIVSLYVVGESLLLFNQIIRLIFENSYIYLNRQQKEEVLIWIGEGKTIESEQKLNLILDVFLPIYYEIRIYWENHFGIIGADNTMHIDQIVMY